MRSSLVRILRKADLLPEKIGEHLSPEMQSFQEEMRRMLFLIANMGDPKDLDVVRITVREYMRNTEKATELVMGARFNAFWTVKKDQKETLRVLSRFLEPMGNKALLESLEKLKRLA